MTISPNSLANLVPIQPGQITNPAGRQKNQPVITPVMRHYAERPIQDLLNIQENDALWRTLPVKDCIAITMLLKAVDKAEGDKTRDDVLRRLDGAESKDVGVEVQVGVLVRYVDGAE